MTNSYLKILKLNNTPKLITTRMCSSSRCIDNCAFECLVAQRQGHTFSVPQTDVYRTSWNRASVQIQRMIDCLDNEEPCEVTNTVELIKTYQILNLCFNLITTYNDESQELDQIGNLVKQNLDEYERIEDICVKLVTMAIGSSMVSYDGFKYMIERNKLVYITKYSYKFFEKMNKVSQNRQTFEEIFSKCPETKDFDQLYDELSNLKYSGEYFTKQIAQMTQHSNQLYIPQVTVVSISQPNDFVKYQTSVSELVHLQQVLSIVTDNNLMLVDIKNMSDNEKFDLSNASLHNVVFTCAKSTSEIRDIVLKETHLNIRDKDIEFMLENIDRLIKSNFDNLIPVIKKYAPVKQIVEKEKQNRDASKQLDFSNGTLTNNSPLVKYETSETSNQKTVNHSKNSFNKPWSNFLFTTKLVFTIVPIALVIVLVIRQTRK